MQLVSEARLDAARDALGTVSGFHVYSLAAVAPKDAAALCSLDYIQASELHLQPQDRSNCLRDNRHSAVRCPMVRRVQADLRGTVASVSAAPKQAPAPKSAPIPQPDTAPIPKPAPAAAGPIQTEKPPVEEKAKTEPAPVRCTLPPLPPHTHPVLTLRHPAPIPPSCERNPNPRNILSIFIRAPFPSLIMPIPPLANNPQPPTHLPSILLNMLKSTYAFCVVPGGREERKRKHPTGREH